MSNLLPPNSTALEQRLTEAVRFDDLPAPLRDLWNPETCPVDLLPWLAWAWSVDYWDSEWSDTQKRRVVADAVYIHRHKGTLGAIRRALASLDFEATVSEWFEHDGAPYTFRVQTKGTFSDDAAYQRLLALIERAKNVRSLLAAVVIEREAKLDLRFATATAQGVRMKMGPRPAVNQVKHTDLLQGSARHEARTMTVLPQQFTVAIETTVLTWRGVLHELRYTTVRGS